jgi:uncharacterized membrane protein YgcG
VDREAWTVAQHKSAAVALTMERPTSLGDAAYDLIAKGPYADDYVSFCPTRRRYHCDLCNVDLDEEDYTNHRNGSPHIDLAVRVFRMQEIPAMVLCSSLQKRINQLGSKVWRREVQFDLYWVFMDPDNALSKARAAEEALWKYENLERSALLALAVWKAVCISRQSGVAKDFYSWQYWIRQGWKERKSGMFRSGEVGVIVALVFPFIGDANVLSSNQLLLKESQLESITSRGRGSGGRGYGNDGQGGGGRGRGGGGRGYGSDGRGRGRG